ncbi:PREDICTED: WD repeat-containing protein 3-like, partial [Tauraco erythrolophus]|uniref:WD repeat-containing protein 3-like n=1 Tax=Tauraco erythrolophus TaxID=121530 RepID=UPI00052366C0
SHRCVKTRGNGPLRGPRSGCGASRPVRKVSRWRVRELELSGLGHVPAVRLESPELPPPAAPCVRSAVLILKGLKQEVSCLCPSPDELNLAIGYEDGSIRVFSLLSGEANITFNGHKAAVTALQYDHLGGRLVSGSKDTDVIVWDVINESGLYRLKGHKDAVTQVLFLKEKNLLVTSGKDTLVKWWDLDTQHCFKTLVGHRTEVWGMALISEEKRLITGSADSELRVWDITYIQE